MKVSGKGFTIIEMLVVIAIILILAGIVFKLMPFAVRIGKEALTKNKLERIANALNEFKAEYGQYPPAASANYSANMDYEYENVGLQIPFLRYDHFTVHPYSDTSVLWSYGLCAYLYKRDKECIEHKASVNWNDDSARDKAAKEKWNPFVKGIDSQDWEGHSVYEIPNIKYTNSVQTIKDAWFHRIRYVCYQPYQTYKLWSAGADGVDKTPDDINWEGWDK